MKKIIILLIFSIASFWVNSQCLITDVANDYPKKEILATKTSLPISLSWRETMGPVGDQGIQGSCVAWSVSYTITQQKAQKNNWDFQNHAYEENLVHWVSPASIYNPVHQLYKPWMSGIGYADALNQVVSQGIAFMNEFYYNQYDDSTQMNMDLRITGLSHRSQEWFWSYDHQVAKEQLQFGPINSSIHNESGSNHALCIVGYNDTILIDGKVGAFLVINSVGPNWGDQGFAWYPYSRFSQAFYFLKDTPEDLAPQQIIRFKFNLAEKPIYNEETSFFLIANSDSTELVLCPVVNDFLLPIDYSDITAVYINSEYTTERDKPIQPIEMIIDSCWVYDESKGFNELEFVQNRFDTILDTIIHSPVHITYRLYSQLTVNISLPIAGIISPDWPTASISLSAYPNPFCGQITFRIDLPYSGVVDLAVYDLNGKILTKLADKVIMPNGEHLFNWAANLPTGVYMVKFSYNNQTATQKIMAVR